MKKREEIGKTVISEMLIVILQVILLPSIPLRVNLWLLHENWCTRMKAGISSR